MISIIINILNEAKALPETLRMIFAQTYTNREVIIVDDGSQDDIAGAVKPFLHRVRFFSRPHEGRQKARNFGITNARGEYIFVCDADIRLRPDCLEKMIHALQEHFEAAFAYSAFRLGWKTFKSFSYDKALLEKMNYINTASLVRRERHPGFDENIKKFQDWDVWLALAQQGHAGVYIPEVLFSFNESPNRPMVPGLSKWFPKIAYRIPWGRLGIHISALEQYEKGMEAIGQKYNLGKYRQEKGRQKESTDQCAS